MIDRQKALKGLECHRNGFCFACPYNDDVIETTNCKRQLVEDAIALLKNEPLLVLNIGKFRIYFGDCPACGKRIYYKISRYCPHCGQAVKWE